MIKGLWKQRGHGWDVHLANSKVDSWSSLLPTWEELLESEETSSWRQLFQPLGPMRTYYQMLNHSTTFYPNFLFQNLISKPFSTPSLLSKAFLWQSTCEETIERTLGGAIGLLAGTWCFWWALNVAVWKPRHALSAIWLLVSLAVQFVYIGASSFKKPSQW